MRSQEPPHHVGRTAGGSRHDKADVFGGFPVRQARSRQDRCGREAGSTGEYATVAQQFIGHESTPCFLFYRERMEPDAQRQVARSGTTPPAEGSAKAEQLEDRRYVA